MQFPKDFWWGTSTASHQIEGNIYNDWTEWEKVNAKKLAIAAPKIFSKLSPVWNEVKSAATDPANYVSGIADDSYNRFDEDLQLMAALGVNAYRFSIEWSRIEPQEGQFNQEALDHYGDIIQKLRARNIEPFITILHRTVPLWFNDKGGWSDRSSVQRFQNYAQVLAQNYSQDVRYWMPLNEPVLNVGGGYLAGKIPPGRKNLFAAVNAYSNMIKAHNAVYSLIHGLRPDALVGTTHAAIYVEPYRNRWYNRLAVAISNYFSNWKFLDGVKYHSDFTGIQYYTRGVINLLGIFGASGPLVFQPGPASDMGQEIYPAGIYNFIKLVWDRYGQPIYITENGIADRNDRYRAQYIKDHVAAVGRAVAGGMDVRGYFYWSLLDNFEWDKGFWPRFGLYEVDRAAQQRTMRPSAQVYAKIIKSN